jgi:hypothetical protein
VERLAVSEPVVGDEVDAAADELARGPEVLEVAVRRSPEDAFEVVRPVAARKEARDDRPRARAGDRDPLVPAFLREREQRAHERDALDPAALEDGVRLAMLCHCDHSSPAKTTDAAAAVRP